MVSQVLHYYSSKDNWVGGWVHVFDLVREISSQIGLIPTPPLYRHNRKCFTDKVLFLLHHGNKAVVWFGWCFLQVVVSWRLIKMCRRWPLSKLGEKITLFLKQGRRRWDGGWVAELYACEHFPCLYNGSRDVLLPPPPSSTSWRRHWHYWQGTIILHKPAIKEAAMCVHVRIIMKRNFVPQLKTPLTRLIKS